MGLKRQIYVIYAFCQSVLRRPWINFIQLEIKLNTITLTTNDTIDKLINECVEEEKNIPLTRTNKED